MNPPFGVQTRFADRRFLKKAFKFSDIVYSIHLANKKDIKVIISTVVMKNNMHLLEDICKLAENLNCAVELYPCEDIVWKINGEQLIVKDIGSYISILILHMVHLLLLKFPQTNPVVFQLELYNPVVRCLFTSFKVPISCNTFKPIQLVF